MAQRLRANHRFMCEGEWKAAGTLRPGDLLTLADGSQVPVTEVRFEDRHETVYNMEVEDYHTYYVSEDGVWVHNTYQGKTNSITVGDSEQSIVYRVIREDEDPLLGLTAKNPSRNMSIEGHVTSGSRNNGSQFISTTTDINVANKYAMQDGCRVIEIDLSKLPNDVQIYDLSTVSGRNIYLSGIMARNFAAKSKEVLLEGFVPSEAIRLH